MDWADLLIPTYVFALSLLVATVRGVWRLIQRLSNVEHGVDRLEDSMGRLSADLREHMSEEGTNIMRLERAIARRNSEEPPHETG